MCYQSAIYTEEIEGKEINELLGLGLVNVFLSHYVCECTLIKETNLLALRGPQLTRDSSMATKLKRVTRATLPSSIQVHRLMGDTTRMDTHNSIHRLKRRLTTSKGARTTNNNSTTDRPRPRPRFRVGIMVCMVNSNKVGTITTPREGMLRHRMLHKLNPLRLTIPPSMEVPLPRIRLVLDIPNQ